MNEIVATQPELGFDANVRGDGGNALVAGEPVKSAQVALAPDSAISPLDTISDFSSSPDGLRRADEPIARPETAAVGDRLPDKLYFKIGEVAKLIGVEPYVLRYWETEFPQIKPAKSQAKQRLYKRQDVETIAAIHELLYNQRFTISGARRQLKNRGKIARVNTAVTATEHDNVAPPDTMPPLPVTPTSAPFNALPGEKMAEFRSILAEMDEFLAE